METNFLVPIRYNICNLGCGGDGWMLLQEAIKLRILELAAERGYSVNKLAERSGIAPSVLKKTVKPYATVKNSSTELIARICVGLEIPFKALWDSPLFDSIETRQ